MEELRDNDWPLPFEPPPHVDDWQSVARKKGQDAPEVALMLEERKSVLECHSGWEALLGVFLHRCRSYFNDFAGPVEKRRFEGSGLILTAHSDNRMSRETYQKDQCLSDLQSIADLLSHPPRHKRKPTKKSRFAACLRDARLKHGDSQKQMAGTTGLDQPEISMFERGVRKPKDAKLKACISYMKEVQVEAPSD